MFWMIIKKYNNSYKLYIHNDNETFYLTLKFFFSKNIKKIMTHPIWLDVAKDKQKTLWNVKWTLHDIYIYSYMFIIWTTIEQFL